MPDQPGYWAVMRHADVTHVARRPDLFSAEVGGVVLEDMAPEQLATEPEHAADDGSAAAHAHRKPLAESFQAKVIAQMEGRIRELCQRDLRRGCRHG